MFSSVTSFACMVVVLSFVTFLPEPIYAKFWLIIYAKQLAPSASIPLLPYTFALAIVLSSPPYTVVASGVVLPAEPCDI